jgi:Ni/Fe-hydrogenase subunit HybB-like protein
MESAAAGLVGAVGTTVFFAFCAFAVWIDYRKKKDESDAAHRERMRALELGCPPLDGEIARAKAYASAAWAAGLIGLLVPLAVAGLTCAATIVAVLKQEYWQNIAVPLIVAWSIAAGLMLVIIVRSLTTIRQLPRPTAETRATTPEKQVNVLSTGFREERSPL